MVVIRLSRTGAKKRPFYHVVAADKRCPRDGRNIEQLGYFNPIASGEEFKIHLNIERVEYWLSCGAQPSERVERLIKDFKKMPPREEKPKKETVKAAAKAQPTKAVKSKTTATAKPKVKKTKAAASKSSE
jgi:small subunit ribosomal protein S16